MSTSVGRGANAGETGVAMVDKEQTISTQTGIYNFVLSVLRLNETWLAKGDRGFQSTAEYIAAALVQRYNITPITDAANVAENR